MVQFGTPVSALKILSKRPLFAPDSLVRRAHPPPRRSLQRLRLCKAILPSRSMLRNHATGAEKRRLLSWSTPSLPHAPWFDRDEKAAKQRLKEQGEALRTTLRTKDELAQALKQMGTSLVRHTPGQASVVSGVDGRRSAEQPRLSRVLSARSGGSSPTASRSPSPSLSPEQSFDERLRAIFNKFDEDSR